MRVLVATTAGAGHFSPMVPVARACAAAGHEVLVAAPESFRATVASAGFAHAAFADVHPEVMGQVFGRLPGSTFVGRCEVAVRRIVVEAPTNAGWRSGVTSTGCVLPMVGERLPI